MAARVLFVMHEHFPAIYFKYILIVASLVIALAVLVRLLRTVANPRGDWLLKQYREAYTNFLCPICEFPIRWMVLLGGRSRSILPTCGRR